MSIKFLGFEPNLYFAIIKFREEWKNNFSTHENDYISSLNALSEKRKNMYTGLFSPGHTHNMSKRDKDRPLCTKYLNFSVVFIIHLAFFYEKNKF